MKLEDWLHASPDHDVLLRAEPGGRVRATLRGEQPDGRWIGVGDDKDKAIALKPVPGYVTPTVKKLERASHPLASISGVKE